MSDKSVSVYLHDQAAGFLSVDEYGTLRFRYSPEYLASGNQALSYSLPLQEDEFYGGSAHNFFAGLLPEEGMATAMAEAIGTDVNNRFRLLLELGKECVGAVRIGDPADAKTNQYRELTDSDLEQLILEKENLQPLAYTEQNMRLSLAGAQAKIGLFQTEENYSLPLNGAASNIIVKPPSSRYPSLISNEYVTMQLAKKCSIHIPDVQLVQAGSTQFYGIKRYDRKLVDGSVKRLHQEDFCQALGIASRNKYEKDGGPSFTQSIELLRRHSSVPATDILQFVHRFLFNFIIGNRDAHGKNFSFVMDQGKIVLSPAYDLVNTTIYPFSTENAMSVNGKFEPDLVEHEDWIAMFENSHLKPKLYAQLMRQLANTLPALVEEQLAEVEDIDGFKKEYRESVLRNIEALQF